MFNEITEDTTLTTRHNDKHSDYNYLNPPAVKKYLEQFPVKKLVSNWNNLDLDLKSTADALEFKQLFKEKKLMSYKFEPDCIGNCYICDN